MKPVTMPRARAKQLLSILALFIGLGIVAIYLVWGLPNALMADASQVDSGSPQREADAPAISFIDSPSPTCYLPAPGTGICYVEWAYLYVSTSSPSYIISMTVSINNQMRANHTGFFQTEMLIPSGMTAPGYRVTCGLPGSGGVPGWGNVYSYQIRARDTDGLTTSNFGSVRCPADIVTIYLPLAVKP